MGTAARRPVLVGGLVALLAVAGAVLALRLEPTTATGTLVERGSPTWSATEDLHRRFGDDAIYVLVRVQREGPPRARAQGAGQQGAVVILGRQVDRRAPV